MIKAVLISAGSAIILYSLFIAINMKFNSGIILVAVSGISAFLFGIFYDTLNAQLWFRVIFYTAASIVFVLAFMIFLYALNDNVTGSEDAVIVLGCGLKGDRIGRQLTGRLDAAVVYCKRNENAVIVVSGGKGKGETVTEAFAMERYLVSKGIEKSRIIKEERSKSTYTNLKYSKNLLDDRFANRKYKAVVITSGYHIFRAAITAKKAGLHYTHLHAPTPVCQLPVCYARECAAIVKYLLFHR